MYLKSDTSSSLWREQDSNLRPLGYEPNELPLLHPAMSFFVSAKLWTLFYVSKYSALFFR